MEKLLEIKYTLGRCQNLLLNCSKFLDDTMMTVFISLNRSLSVLCYLEMYFKLKISSGFENLEMSLLALE